MFITDGAGTGKSYVIRAIREHIERSVQGSDEVHGCMVMAPTGVAAFNVDGLAIHRALRLRSHEYDTVSTYPPTSVSAMFILRSHNGHIPSEFGSESDYVIKENGALVINTYAGRDQQLIPVLHHLCFLSFAAVFIRSFECSRDGAKGAIFVVRRRDRTPTSRHVGVQNREDCA